MQTTFDYQQKGIRPDFGQVVLMSSSPRRRELLAFLNPIVQHNEVDERSIEVHFMDYYSDEPFIQRAAKTCCEISKGKLELELMPDTLYIAADTIVINQDQIYNKPADAEEAYQMLKSYFGKTHHVVTSVCLKTENYLDVFYTVTAVRFVDEYPALEPAIRNYAASGSPLDKSGGYGIQELDPRFVAEIYGDIHTVIGLPVAELSRRIHQAE